ncbi:hypothetical protein AMTRI_Chr06g191490 [Amborella trichopoda]
MRYSLSSINAQSNLKFHTTLAPHTPLSLLQKCSNTKHLNQLLCLLITNPIPNLFTWNAIIRAYAHSSQPQQSVLLYNHILRHYFLSLDNYTFPFVFKACARLSLKPKGEEIHATTVKLGFESDVFVQNSMVSMYGSCKSIREAKMVFDSMKTRDVVSWNCIIACYLQRGESEHALKQFEEMLRNSINPNGFTIASALAACARTGDLDSGKRLHNIIHELGLGVDVFVGSALIDLYSKCGSIVEARNVFDEMPERNVVSWTSMIAGYSQLGYFKEAIELFREMQVKNVNPDEATVVCVLMACAHLGALDMGRWVHAFCEKNHIEMNLTVNNSLIDMYSKCGSINRASALFREMVKKDVFSWTVMISGLAMNGDCYDALELFKQMDASSVRPNEVTFLGVLSACSHGGLVREGHHYFNLMIENYGLKPRIEHYGCMVDLLGRANLLLQAADFIELMPIKPDAVIWRALLYACRQDGDIKLAERAAKEILKLEPGNCGVHVMLSNIYASFSKWEDVHRVRKFIRDGGVRKQPGCTFIEVNGVIHEFLVADDSHPQFEMLCSMLIGMDSQLRLSGYVPSTSKMNVMADLCAR